jgi:hypothetical protein
MKKKSDFNLLKSIPLLYFLFIATIIHLGYFILLKETRSLVIFILACVFVYLVNPNMIIVLGISLIFVDMLYLVQSMSTNEGFLGEIKFTPEIKDTSMNQVKLKENMENVKDVPINPLIKARDLILQENMDETKTSQETDLKEDAKKTNKMKDVIDKVKKSSPELMDSEKRLNSIDISELNKLINNLNKVVNTMSD